MNNILTEVFMQSFIALLRREPVMIIAGILAVVSMFYVTPSADYFKYIDYDVLALLFSLMVIMAGLEEIGFFNKLAESLLVKTTNIRMLIFVLVMLCFFVSMFFTNDLVLIVFVPFAIKILQMAEREDRIIITVVLQTIAANLGSMLLPIGNPQNLYLYQYFDIPIWEFVSIIAPYVVISLVVLLVFIGLQPKIAVNFSLSSAKSWNSMGKSLWVYAILFAIALLSVVRIVDKGIMLIIVLAVMLFYNRRAFKIDYCLLLTFVFFFIFVGNLKAIPEVSALMEQLLLGREMEVTMLASQVISNVPATVLFSGFSANYGELLIGASIGGLGTLVASLASLISFKLFTNHTTLSKGRYLLVFTLCNILFIFILIGFYVLFL